jgi:hypothetical protein
MFSFSRSTRCGSALSFQPPEAPQEWCLRQFGPIRRTEKPVFENSSRKIASLFHHSVLTLDSAKVVDLVPQANWNHKVRYLEARTFEQNQSDVVFKEACLVEVGVTNYCRRLKHHAQFFQNIRVFFSLFMRIKPKCIQQITNN